jgi:mRNA-degrading endonuclease RelE of RelBE toxin-antitoxin system
MKQKKSKQEKKSEPPSTTSSPLFKVIVTPSFLSEAYSLKKKYPNIKEDFLALKDRLKTNPIGLGEPLGKDLYKVRMTITDKNSGKSGGARLIIQILIVDKEVYVLSVYDKADKSTITEKEIEKLLRKKLG